MDASYVSRSKTLPWVGLKGSIFTNDHFGAALAAGDFNGDRPADLAVGVPGDDVGNGDLLTSVGAVNVLYGAADVTGWQNLANRFDVNNDSNLSPIDVSLIINYLNAHPGDNTLPEPADPPPFYEVNGDGFVSPIDALLVINKFNEAAIPVASRLTTQLAAALLDADDSRTPRLM